MSHVLRLPDMTTVELLQAHSAVLAELKRRGIVRTRNNPVADYAEWLVCQRLELKMEHNSTAGFDAAGGDGIRYHIKSRRIDAAAVRRGARLGRPSVLDRRARERVRRLRASGKSIRAIAAMLGVSVGTVHSVVVAQQ